jgi:hypothetical protein
MAIEPEDLGIAFGLGFEAGKDEIMEGPEEEPESEVEEDDSEIIKVPVSDRFKTKKSRRTRPFLRWLDDVKKGNKVHTDELEYTKDELWKIIEHEGNTE